MPALSVPGRGVRPGSVHWRHADRRRLGPRRVRPEGGPGRLVGGGRPPGRRPRHRLGEVSVDYPDFGVAVGRAVAAGEVDLGVCACGTGIGISIAANKVAGVRAALVHDVTTARLARQHNDANVVCLGGRTIGAWPPPSTRWTPSSPPPSTGPPRPSGGRDRRPRAGRRGGSRRPARQQRRNPMTASAAHPLRRLAGGRPRGRRAARCRDRPPVDHPAAHRLGELHLAGRAGRLGLGAHQQVRRGLPGPPLLRRQPGHRRGGGPGPRAGPRPLFGAEHANVQPHAGANANLAVYQALLEPGDTILAMRLDHGGHLTHGSPASITSQDLALRLLRGAPRPPATRTQPGEVIDFDQVADLARAERPQLIVAGSTAYSRIIDPVPFREIADSVGALFMFDAAHPAGLIAGGAHPSPVGVADVVTFTTHKTLRGPRGGAILCGAELAKTDRQRRLPGPAGGPARARHRGQGGRLRRGGPARVPPPTPHAGGGQRPGPGRRPGRRGVPAGLGGHRQPPGAGRPAALRRRADRQGGPGGARPGRASPATATPSPTTPARPS